MRNHPPIHQRVPPQKDQKDILRVKICLKKVKHLKTNLLKTTGEIKPMNLIKRNLMEDKTSMT